MSAKKSNLQTKKVAFQGKEMTLYSIDGVTWSTRPDELELIIQRHSTEQAAYSSDLKGEEREKVEKVKPKPKKFARVHDDGELDEIIEEDSVEEDLDDDIPLDDIDDDIDVDLDVDIPSITGKKDSKKPVIAQKAKSTPAVAAKATSKAPQKAPAKIAPKSAQKKAPAKPVKAVKPTKPAKAKPAKSASKPKKAPPVKGKRKAA